MELEIAAPRDAVWRALTDAREIERWFALAAQVEPGPGGRVVWEWPGAARWPHRIETWTPGERLLTRYDSAVADVRGAKIPLFVDCTLRGSKGTTTLRLVHSGFGPEADFDAEFDGISRGWSVELLALRHYLERHRGKDRHVAWGKVDLDGDVEAAWLRLCGPDALSGAMDLDALRDGDSIRVTVAGVPDLEGHVLKRAGRFEIAASIANRGEAFLRVAVESCADGPQAWLWLALWGDAAPEAARMQSAFDATLARLFPRAGSSRVEVRNA